MKKVVNVFVSLVLVFSMCLGLAGCDLLFGPGKPKLDAPENPAISGNIFSWDAVDGSDGYKVSLHGISSSTLYDAPTASFEIPLLAAGNYSMSVKAIAKSGGEYSDSDYSESVSYVSKATEGLTYSFVTGSTNDCEVSVDVSITGTLLIPSSVPSDYTNSALRNRPVTRIKAQGFAGKTGITAVMFPNGIFEIGAEAFYGCTGITSVVIPITVDEIGANAFEGCTALKKVVMTDLQSSGTTPAPEVIISANAFLDCTGLNTIVISKRVTEIGNSAFRNCGVLTIYYGGADKTEWDKITVADEYNDRIKNATKYYYSEYSPAYDKMDTSWHYVNDNPTKWQ